MTKPSNESSGTLPVTVPSTPSSRRQPNPTAILALMVLFGLPSCISTVHVQRVDPDRWVGQLGEGGEAFLRSVEAAAEVYHKIADTGMDELRTEECSASIGKLVTKARDQLRRANSFEMILPKYDMVDVYQTREEFLGDVNVLNVRSEFPSRLDLSSFGYRVVYGCEHREGTENLCIVTFRSTRGRKICTLTETSPGVRTVRFHEPFASIVTGDKIQSIRALVAEIKR